MKRRFVLRWLLGFGVGGYGVGLAGLGVMRLMRFGRMRVMMYNPFVRVGEQAG